MDFTTTRLTIRPTNLDDSSFILELLNTPKWHQYVGDRKVRTELDAKKYIETKMLPQFNRLGFGNYTMIRKSGKRKVGVCGLYDRPGMEGVDIGFGLLPDYEGKGYAFEAARLILDMAFDEFKLKVVKGITSKENFASQKLLQKLGFKNMGTIRLPDDEEELFLFQIN